MADKRESIEMDSRNGVILGYHNPNFEKNGKIGDVNVKVSVEVSEAITGLKALQREAKAATQALAELRQEQAKCVCGNGASW
ncbi:MULTISPECIES: hypothetical protein [Bacillus amyloliquefaciens group]|uniref:hypothetical protein n=1 Tax=Bacillus amyloliquefaciens group TaxID=1938374 RepID=UPI0002059473|nr:hypothetical protein [Bacillus amyloliquefaciens]AIW35048.1 hypothetical protein KS08_15925 [Bacillus subtilis]AEB25387.1 hypothetical protein BAMTA208_16175 [Bacillus amyloliquefaciens TA208]AEK90416.1 hypothetical protein BAXH7_03302 [Bacillus amyloliquefaciens XH7]MEC1831338.1 hypothetical protein [Bacillus amyloliquefaciens]MEC1835000.1 hypothetical protein [Bacillus amyloliquefaciens]